MTDQGWEEPFIVISKVGGDEVTPDTPTPIKANAGDLITLTVTVPDAYIVTNFKINGSVAPQKTSGDGVNPAAYTFKVTTTSVISGTLTPKDPADLISVGDSVFDNTLNQLYIAQGILAAVEQQGSFNSSWSFKSTGGEEGTDEGSGEPESVFSSEVTEYTAAVPFSGYPAVITAIPTETEAGVNISSTDPGANNGVFTVTITVTAPFWKLYPDYTPQDGDPPLPENAEQNKAKDYTITVTREPGSSDKTLSSLSALETVLTEKGGVYAGTVGAAVTDLHINAVAAHSSAKVQVGFKDAATPNLQDAANIVSTIVSGLENGANSITVKVTAEDGSGPTDYTVGIYRDNTAPEPVDNAVGGIVSTHDGYEIHTFVVDGATLLGEQKEYTLTFNKKPAGGAIELLVVGGGGAGGSVNETTHRGGGGGAGGFVYVPDYKIESDNAVFTVKVGAGGAKVAASSKTKGGNGADSAFGNDIVAYGGGGASNNYGGDNVISSAGGSGGGGSRYGGGAATKGLAAGYNNALILGNAGGNGLKNGVSYAAGGGGAKEPGSNTITNGSVAAGLAGSSGGSGTLSAISGAEKWYAGGGAGGANDSHNNYGAEQYGANKANNGAANTGDGGGGGGGIKNKYNGGNGGSGIVIARWKHNAD